MIAKPSLKSYRPRIPSLDGLYHHGRRSIATANELHSDETTASVVSDEWEIENMGIGVSNRRGIMTDFLRDCAHQSP